MAMFFSIVNAGLSGETSAGAVRRAAWVLDQPARLVVQDARHANDEAAIAAIRTWRCNPATRNGRPVRATALQPIKFVLQGN